MFKRFVSSLLAVVLVGTLLVGCGSNSSSETAEETSEETTEEAAEEAEETEIQVFIAASLNTVMTELA